MCVFVVKPRSDFSRDMDSINVFPFVCGNTRHTARKVFNSFQTLLNHIQGCVGCQMKGKTSIDMNLVVFCAKIQLELKNLQKCGKDPKIRTFFEVFHSFFKCSPILVQSTT